MLKKLAVAATFAVLASSAMAAPAIYAGADFGTTKVDVQTGRYSSFGSFVGVQVTPMFGVEAGVRRLADGEEAFTNLTVRQTHVSLIATLPVAESVNVYGRVGYNRLQADVSNKNFSSSDKTNSVLYGLGVSVDLTPVIGARLEAQQPHHDVSNVSASLVFKF